jgi:hypothetical protein
LLRRALSSTSKTRIIYQIPVRSVFKSTVLD